MLTLKNITVAFGDNVVLEDLTLNAGEGQIIGVVAPNGMGKTTMFNVISNYVKPNEGEVIFFGKDKYGTEKDELKIRHHLAFMPEQRDLFHQLSGVDHLKLYANMWQKTDEHVEQIIEDLNMGYYVKDKVYTYSLGMRQRLCFAMMLAANTPIMLMDEVMNGLDVSNVILITEHLERLRAENKLIFIASHLLDNLDLYADRVLFLRDRKIIHDKKREEESELYLKVPLVTEEYESVKVVHSLPDSHLYIANRLLAIPLEDIKEDQHEWIERFMPYASENITIGPLGTHEQYERYYYDTF